MDIDNRERNRGLILAALKGLREMLPGDSRFGDPLSTSGDEQSHLIARQVAEASEERPGLLRGR